MKTPNSVIEWFKDYRLEQGVDILVEARRTLVCHCVPLAEKIKELETRHKEAYHNRRIGEAQNFLQEEGTVAERNASSVSEELRLEEARSEGELRGHKIMFEVYLKVLDSMASMINVLNR